MTNRSVAPPEFVICDWRFIIFYFQKVADFTGAGLWFDEGSFEQFDALLGRFAFDFNLLELIQNLHPLDYLAEGGIFTVQTARISEAYEERRFRAVRFFVAGHAHDTFDVPGFVELRLELFHQILNTKVRQRRLSGRKKAALHDKVANDPVETGPVIKAGLGQAQEVADMVGCELGQELQNDLSQRGLENGAIS